MEAEVAMSTKRLMPCKEVHLKFHAMKHLEQTYTVKAPIAKIWQALTDPKVIEGWGGGPAKIVDKVNTQFSLWGGEIHGTNTKVNKPYFLNQDWYSGHNWEQPSKVEFTI